MKQPDQLILDIYTSKAQADKAISSLKGILLGINLDGDVNNLELKELEKWAIAHDSLIGRNPFNEFMNTITEAINNKLPSSETIEDLYWLSQKYERDNYYYNPITSDLQILQGLCHGIMSDGVINDQEVIDLNKWIEENEHLNSYYPYDEIRSLLLSVLSDSKIDDEERLVLKAYFNEFVNLQDSDMSEQIAMETNGVNISGLCTSEPNVVFTGMTFCITGILQRNSRQGLKEKIIRLGGIPTDSITLQTDYLIVGDNGNPAWAFSCYGRKVEKAINMRKGGHTIMLIHEFDFADIVDDLNNTN